jgi:hypothetical protein
MTTLAHRWAPSGQPLCRFSICKIRPPSRRRLGVAFGRALFATGTVHPVSGSATQCTRTMSGSIPCGNPRAAPLHEDFNNAGSPSGLGYSRSERPWTRCDGMPRARKATDGEGETARPSRGGRAWYRGQCPCTGAVRRVSGWGARSDQRCGCRPLRSPFAVDDGETGTIPARAPSAPRRELKWDSTSRMAPARLRPRPKPARGPCRLPGWERPTDRNRLRAISSKIRPSPI